MLIKDTMEEVKVQSLNGVNHLPTF